MALRVPTEDKTELFDYVNSQVNQSTAINLDDLGTGLVLLCYH